VCFLRQILKFSPRWSSSCTQRDAPTARLWLRRMADAGLLGAIVGQVAADAARGTKVLFVTGLAPTDADMTLAEDIARRAALGDSVGWAVVSTSSAPGLDGTLDDLAQTGQNPGAIVVSLDGAPIVMHSRDDDGFDVVMVEVD
jgi:hypothetical protein